MKKIKIMLSAVAVFAIVGGALAFKTTSPNYCFFELKPDGSCPFQSHFFTTSTDQPDVIGTYIQNTLDCTTITTIEEDDCQTPLNLDTDL